MLLFLRSCQTSMKQPQVGQCAVTDEDWYMVCRCIDELEALAFELAPLAKKMDADGTAHEAPPVQEPDLQVNDLTFDGTAHAMFERYQMAGRYGILRRLDRLRVVQHDRFARFGFVSSVLRMPCMLCS